MDWKNTFQPHAHTQNDSFPELMMTHVSDWSAITMVGDDKKSYLQGQVTCDVVTLPNDESTLGAHCDAKGKVWSIFRLFHHNGGYALMQPKSAIEVELVEIKKYAVFSKVDIEQTSDVVIGVMGAAADQYIDSISESQGKVRAISGGTAVQVADNRWALLVTEQAAEAMVTNSSAEKVSEALWQYHEIIDAQPNLTKAEQNEHIPQALNLQAIGGISFTKGCYTGQETVARAKYRGMNKREMRIVSGPTAEVLTLESPIDLERSVRENWRGAGRLINVYQFSDNQAIGLMVLPNNLDDEVQLRLTAQPDQIWNILPLPYSLDDE
ncbi:tRNA-modifying protein YgfZ [Vibrio sp. Isolate31]|uniref:tRNA-modifying protein YgfZ n=1 Tax=unclassified Vibrio TaxID=2614977 RepID=UPI001EFEB834|nr:MULTISPECIES: tRNA-modifying protein YgfZ [unclassified Vibrio]MCG9552367.1 tRNA-modifying protein YgfZ [Vibrio sp. Isolate32]MCG9599444.1 tRNA-modifying protein YgfZ [Vibrio sp. Isolate31]